MVFAEFYHRGVMTGKLIPACGSDSVCYIDGRLALCNMKSAARDVAKRRGFPAFRIMRGPAFNRAAPMTELIAL